MTSDPGTSSDQAAQAVQVARLYFYQGLTTGEIAAELGVSRPRVSRLLTLARRSGLVEIRIHDPPSIPRCWKPSWHPFSRPRAARGRVPPGSSEALSLERVAAYSANLLGNTLQPGQTVGLAWGNTLDAVSRALKPRAIPELTFVQLNGSANAHDFVSGFVTDTLLRFARAYGGRAHLFPVPTFFDNPQTKHLMWQERSVRHVLGLQDRAEVLLYSLGSTQADSPSHVYTAGYLGVQEQTELGEQGVVGDLATVFYRADGSSGAFRSTSAPVAPIWPGSGPPLRPSAWWRASVRPAPCTRPCGAVWRKPWWSMSGRRGRCWSWTERTRAELAGSGLGWPGDNGVPNRRPAPLYPEAMTAPQPEPQPSSVAARPAAPGHAEELHAPPVNPLVYQLVVTAMNLPGCCAASTSTPWGASTFRRPAPSWWSPGRTSRHSIRSSSPRSCRATMCSSCPKKSCSNRRRRHHQGGRRSHRPQRQRRGGHSHRAADLKEDGSLGLFPEGTRGGGQMQGGVALIALRGRAPVLPVGLRRDGKRWLVRFGPSSSPKAVSRR